MNITEAVDIVALRLGNRTDLDTKIQTEMGNVQEFQLERAPILPWFLVSEDATATTTAAEDRLKVPLDFLREVEPSALWYQDSTSDIPWKMLEKHDYDSLRCSLGVTMAAAGRPTAYSLNGDYFRLAPVPDAEYTLSMRYYLSDTNPSALSGTDTNLWLTWAADLVIAYTCVVMGRQLRYRADAQQQFMADREEAVAIFWRDQEARLHANRRYVMGI